MARKKKPNPESAAHALDSIETRSDQLVAWLNENAMLVLGVAAAILVVAGVWGLSLQQMRAAESESAGALAQALADYRTAMGATPGAIEIAEPANPETGRRVRGEFIGRFQEVAAEHAGSSAGALALLEAGKLQQQLGETEAAAASYQRGIESLPEGDPAQGFLLMRLGTVREAEAAWAAAGDAYAAAGQLDAFPLRFEALADAARSYATAGDRMRALDAYGQLESEAPDYRVAPYIEARLQELRDASQPGEADVVEAASAPDLMLE